MVSAVAGARQWRTLRLAPALTYPIPLARPLVGCQLTVPVVVGRGLGRVPLDTNTEPEADHQVVILAAASVEAGMTGVADGYLIVGQLASKDAGHIAA